MCKPTDKSLKRNDAVAGVVCVCVEGWWCGGGQGWGRGREGGQTVVGGGQERNKSNDPQQCQQKNSPYDSKFPQKNQRKTQY